MTEILVLEKPEEKLRRERERLLGELSVYGERLTVLQDTVDEIKEMIEYYDGAIESLERLREKEIEHAKKNTKTLEEVLGEITKTNIVGKYFDETYFNREDLLRRLQSDDYDYLTRHENGELWAHSYPPKKQWDKWTSRSYVKKIYNDNFPEVQWSDEEPTKISKLLANYQNGGENVKVEVE